MDGLFNQNTDFNADIYRNITSLKKPISFYDDLIKQDDDLLYATHVANLAEDNIKSNFSNSLIMRDFHYSTSIAYPFEKDSFMSSRFGDGSYGVWYGSLELETTIAETIYHSFEDENAIEDNNELIYRERALYQVHCQSLLLDFRGKEIEFPLLISNNYSFTHAIGERLHNEGHPGCLAPSARCKGTNVVIFNPKVLSKPKFNCYLSYTLNIPKQTATITNLSSKQTIKLNYDELTR